MLRNGERGRIIVSANAHFVHGITAYQPKTLHELWAVADFRFGDDVGFDMPNHVEVGASGDFYANDQHNHRILRVSPTGKIVTAYLFPPELLHKINPAWNVNSDCNIFDFRVCEKTHTFDISVGPNWDTHWYAVDFDANGEAQPHATALKLPAGYNRDTGEMVGGLDVDEEGNLYSIGGYQTVVQMFTADGKPNGALELADGRSPPAADRCRRAYHRAARVSRAGVHQARTPDRAVSALCAGERGATAGGLHGLRAPQHDLPRRGVDGRAASPSPSISPAARAPSRRTGAYGRARMRAGSTGNWHWRTGSCRCRRLSAGSTR